jgi:hypothetical protein
MTRLSIIFAIALLSGCTAARHPDIEPTETPQRKLNEYEEKFDPSKYDINDVKRSPGANDSSHTQTQFPSKPETTSGFRVQVLSTTSIEKANDIKNDMMLLLKDEATYVVFDSPYYKVRVGDYLSRAEANPMLKMLIEKGYTDAWVVPDKVLKMK